MRFEILYTEEAARQRRKLENSPDLAKRWKSVRKALGWMEATLRHPALRTHKYQTLRGPRGEEVFESYAENNTPGAYRLFWHYGPAQGQITILAIVPHP